MEAPNEEEVEEEEEEGGIFIHTQHHQGLKDWQKIRFPPLLPSSSSSNHRAQAQAHSRAPWEMVMNNDDDNDNCFIFPPSNHEGLHIVAEEEEEHDDDVTLAPEAELLQSSMSVEVEQRSSQEQPFDLRVRDAGEIVLKRLGLGFEMLWLKFIRIGALFRSYCNNNSSSRKGGVWWCTTSEAGGVAAVGLLLVPLLYWWQRRRRRRAARRQEKQERLILLIQRTDEKLSLLLDQITHVNDVLTARCRIPMLKSG